MSGSILDKQWLTLHKSPVEDICASIAELNAGESRPVHIGTDAQKHGKFLDFVTAVVVLNPGKGGRVFYTKTRESNINSLHRLFVSTSRQNRFRFTSMPTQTSSGIQASITSS
jgi:predicted RNase H-related nuclease YkuK (DUF458 family)